MGWFELGSHAAQNDSEAVRKGKWQQLKAANPERLLTLGFSAFLLFPLSVVAGSPVSPADFEGMQFTVAGVVHACSSSSTSKVNQ